MPVPARNVIACLLFCTSVAAAAETRHATDPETGIETWETAAHGVSLRLTQILPDQVRGFYLARGFDARSADWRSVSAGVERPLKLEADWQKDWEKRGVPLAARTAFRYALYPTQHRYDIGDWNMGMTTYTLPLGSRFDLRFVWREGDNRREAMLSGVRCATEASP
jgi:hypothetical protein